jgi:hypothetical protein
VSRKALAAGDYHRRINPRLAPCGSTARPRVRAAGDLDHAASVWVAAQAVGQRPGRGRFADAGGAGEDEGVGVGGGGEGGQTADDGRLAVDVGEPGRAVAGEDVAGGWFAKRGQGPIVLIGASSFLPLLPESVCRQAGGLLGAAYKRSGDRGYEVGGDSGREFCFRDGAPGSRR